MKKRLIQTLLAAALALGASGAHAAPFKISPGNWVVTSELNGKAGRGMGLEVRDQTLVMTVYNYTSTGDATFHLTVAKPATPASDVVFKSNLLGYKGGRYLGGPPATATQTASPGEVTVSFDSGTTGTIQFPGEPPLAISRYLFSGLAANAFMQKSETEVWFAFELDADDQLLSSQLLNFTAKDDPNSLTVSGGTCQVSSASGIANCSLKWKDQSVTGQFIRTDRTLEGSITKPGTPSVTHRVVASRTFRLDGTDKTLVVDTALAGNSLNYVPEPGMWLIKSENNGAPGRGLDLDVQGNTMVLQLYGYKADGSPTFHIGAGARQGRDYTVPLLKASGGRYYGSGPLVGTYNGTDGDAVMRFTSSTTGQIRLPGEQFVEMIKLPVGLELTDPAQLDGSWAVSQAEGAPLPIDKLVLNKRSGDTVSTADGIVCRFQTTTQGTVRCTRSFTISGRGTVYELDIRFTPPYAGSTIAYAMKISSTGQVQESSTPDSLFIQRVRANGMLVGNIP